MYNPDFSPKNVNARNYRQHVDEIRLTRSPSTKATRKFEFNQPSHRRSNSGSNPYFPPLIYNEPNLENFLLSSMLEEISPSKDTSPSLNNFESILQNNGTEAARKYLTELLKCETDPKEKGKLIRSAADMAKRCNELSYALDLYCQSTIVDKYTPASWIDRAKLLDEIGDYVHAERVLLDGVKQNSHSEPIIRKLLRSFERTNNFAAARDFLGRSYLSSDFDKEFILLEGALLELRQGNVLLAMQILDKVYQRNDGWRIGVYLDLVVYAEKSGVTDEMHSIISNAMRIVPRNRVITQVYLRHKTDPNEAAEYLYDHMSKCTDELIEKMTIVVCEKFAEHGMMKEMRLLLVESLCLCSAKQRYRLLIASSISELIYGDISFAIKSLRLALDGAPYKSKPLVSILLAKIHELNGEFDEAKKIFEHCIDKYSAEWRVLLEYCHFLVHSNNVKEAIAILDKALQQHPGSGRLSAFRVQLEAYNGIESQIRELHNSIHSVPKSGEVWCEAARIAMNPLTEYFNIEAARQYLEFAYRFTPQHGDTLIEMLRVELLEKGDNADLSTVKQRFICSEGNYGQLFLFIRGLEECSMSEVFDRALEMVREDLRINAKYYQRAIARTSFVVASVNDEQEKLNKTRETVNPFVFTFGISKLSEYMLNPSKCEVRKQLLSLVMGTSACSQ